MRLGYICPLEWALLWGCVYVCVCVCACLRCFPCAVITELELKCQSVWSCRTDLSRKAYWHLSSSSLVACWQPQPSNLPSSPRSERFSIFWISKREKFRSAVVACLRPLPFFFNACLVIHNQQTTYIICIQWRYLTTNTSPQHSISRVKWFWGFWGSLRRSLSFQAPCPQIGLR